MLWSIYCCWFLQAQRHVLTGQYPCTEEDAIYLGGLSMQVINYILITKLIIIIIQFMYEIIMYGYIVYLLYN